LNLFYQPLLPEGVFHLDADESKHAVRVLRKNVGDLIRLIDGKGNFYDASITKADPAKCQFTITSQTAEVKNDYSIHIAISPTKNTDRIEWFVEKAVEIGVDKITLIACQKSERVHLKTDRLERVAISAMKQSLKATLPQINGMSKLTDVIKQSTEQEKFIAYVDQTNPDHLKNMLTRNTSYLVLIGPEGDFSETELTLALQHNFKKVSLGKSRLRTETAGMAACHILNLFNS
jgi:16S rRNA (uracil1498-N3)-methyltransferase